MARSAIIVAAGRGSRMGSQLPKQFLPLAGRPLLMYTIERFFLSDKSMAIVVALPGDHVSRWKALCQEHHFMIDHEIVAGGETRYHSVKNALEKVHPKGWVAVHDGARPLISEVTISRLYEHAKANGNAIPCVPVKDSYRQQDDKGSYRPIDRDALRIVQTPQIFAYEDLIKAYENSFQPSFTDDASVVESAGITLHFFDGQDTNLKVTSPSDLAIAAQLLSGLIHDNGS